ncbi:electron transport complex subunit RsxC [Geomonas propionica]|uniref:Ion-translocating oxidoreductase complex subunit C n=1 Tax=Geomonas propionica TaxID=2798582 RepID=A0ABS0YPF7_9BACT|nr:electron transport complex subunit RsxC [Geomonas propionica]MBJ6799798.1 electron transport complex subunit RsxC [Geomonas propionica]
MKRPTFAGGIHPPGHKWMTAAAPTVAADVPDRLYIPLSQHIGAPCAALVVVGDQVKKGQVIGRGGGFVSSLIHASVSGTVVGIEVMEHPGGSFVPTVIIENDRREEWAETVRPCSDPSALEPARIREIVQEAGIVGMGGATFPSHVKYAPVEGTQVEAVILNGVECEPYLTADHRIMLERPQRIVAGLSYIMRSVGCARGIIAVEDNKLDAAEALGAAAASLPGVTVTVVPEKYPQGSEKQLIYACTGKEVPPGALPIAVGVLVNNVGTAAAVADAVELGTPLIERYLTVSGDGVARPANYLVRIGTLFGELAAQSGGYLDGVERIVAGGPMMGRTVFTDQVPVVKGTSGIVALTGGQLPKGREYPCVRCAKCIDACPAFLAPTSLAKFARRSAWEEAEMADVMSCIECGSCVYVCPAAIPLIQYIKRGKQAVLAARAAGTATGKG